MAVRYIRYLIRAGNGKGHGIHSPFVFSFIRDVLNDNRKYNCYGRIELIRSRLLNDQRQLVVEDLGAGAGRGGGRERSIVSIAKNAAKPPRLAKLLFRVVNYFQPSLMIELGTSLGITTAYLASGNINGKLYTLEGAPAIAAAAKQNLDEAGVSNVEQISGNFDDTLAPLLNRIGTVDFAYIDGNHRYEPTMRYFRQLLASSNYNSIIVLDDIHWSKEMETAWNDIRNHAGVSCTIDLFFLGFVFFRPEFKSKQHFIIRF
ncbi:SAM-dependent methyltransferase [Flavihumibacter sp. ZG627]|nr:SAM-dependent methyltransferase [Flavihumibacter sp. ZG627]